MSQIHKLTATTCTHCGLGVREHLAYYDVPNDGPDLERSCFDPTDGYWEGLYCPPSNSGRSEP